MWIRILFYNVPTSWLCRKLKNLPNKKARKSLVGYVILIILKYILSYIWYITTLSIVGPTCLNKIDSGKKLPNLSNYCRHSLSSQFIHIRTVNNRQARLSRKISANIESTRWANFDKVHIQPISYSSIW